MTSTTNPSGLRHALTSAGYDAKQLQSLGIGVNAPDGSTPSLAQLLERTASPSPFHTLVRLFLLAQPVPRTDAQAAIAPATIESLAEIGLLTDSADGVRSNAAVMPVGGAVTVRDFDPLEPGQSIRPDHVLAVGMATTLLWNLTPRVPVDLALDVGCGQGFQAIALSQHASKVVATDINPRAVAFTRMAAALNGVANIDARAGSLFDPATPEKGRFGLIVSNPPFVIAPSGPVATTAGGTAMGDEIVQRLISGAPDHLADGGIAVLLGNWGHAASTSDPNSSPTWAGRPLAWTKGRGCDALVLGFASQSAADYAQAWHDELRATGTQLPDADRWASDLVARGFSNIAFGAVVLRKRTPGSAPESAPNWSEPIPAPLETFRGLGWPQIMRLLASLTTLHAHAGRETDLLDARLGWAPGLERRVIATGEPAPAPGHVPLRHSQGFALPLDAHAGIVQMLEPISDGKTPRECLEAIAATQPVDRAKAEPNTVGTLKGLLRRGYVGPIA